MDIPPEDIVVKDRLRPGKMLLVDTKAGKLIEDNDLKESYAHKQPYGEWLESNLIKLKDMRIPNARVERYQGDELTKLQKIYGYSYEDVNTYIKKMALNGSEEVVAMGNDGPLAVLSKQHPPLFNYFKQLFAQVTNPPIDAIREEIITSTSLCIGSEGNILNDNEQNCRLLKIENPILSNTDLLKIKNIKKDGFKVAVLSILYYKNTSLEKALDKLFVEADKAYHGGANILILSDRGVDENHVPIPSLLAVAAMNEHLVNTKKRMSVALIIESAEPREVHHYATLIGYGASAVNGYLAQDTIFELIDEGLLDKDYYAAVDDYNEGILHGIVKIASKMGISTIQSYRGSQNFEAIGLAKEFVDKYFPKTVSRIEGKTIKDIEDDVDYRHSRVYDPLGLGVDITLDSRGDHKERSGKEEHLYNPQTIHKLQLATRKGDYQLFKEYSAMIDEEGKDLNLRGLLQFKKTKSIPIDEVESVEKIVKRFSTAAMSLGSISTEAHCTLALAMNHLGGMSNSGEGGEDPLRFKTIDKDCTLQDLLKENAVLPIPLHQGDSLKSKIKQVASGRFGVTASYLDSAEVIQIKMAQGAKPGEGGQLPGDKVTPYIAYLRHCLPGISLVSPPPHHDIYSIEDLAQLIYDLKSVNPRALISVKLVAQNGVGTVAAGVAKCKADHIVISGHDGGTGAAPISSVKNTGGLWEIGLSEVQQTLSLNNLRSRVRVQVDGQIKTGRDVVIGAILGADEFGFGTAPLVALGCMMMRKCQKNTCPAGIATQDPQLRKNFVGKAQDVINYFNFVAQEVREIMASLGIAKFDDLIGHTELLEKENLEDFSKAQSLSFEKILFKAVSKDTAHFNTPQQHEIKQSLDFKLKDEVLEQLLSHKPLSLDLKVKNTDRALGTYLSGQIVHHNLKLEDDFLTLNLKGTAGQSLGAFLTSGITLNLTGEANDYVGKGLCGGLIVIKQDPKFKGKPSENIIAGNTCLYGATEGKAFISGKVGERFAVRNSGATAICEGAGDHLCEYMTGGTVIVLGEIGRNFAAGMSGGIAYIFDPKKEILRHLTPSHEDFLISYLQEQDVEDLKVLENLIKEHHKRTASAKALEILENFKEVSSCFVKVIAKGYQKSLQQLKARGI